jgi:hypothetical protein
MPSNTVTALYDSYESAQNAVRDLKRANVPDADISMIANQSGVTEPVSDTSDNAVTGAEAGASVGGILGAGAGLLAGLGIMAIPGVGPVVAAGWLVATAVGAVAGVGVGGVGGGIIGALTTAGVSQEHANLYAEGVRRGGTLVSARVDASRVTEIEEIMQRYGRVDPVTRERDYRGKGWTSFDDTAVPYGPADAERERTRQLARPVV